MPFIQCAVIITARTCSWNSKILYSALRAFFWQLIAKKIEREDLHYIYSSKNSVSETAAELLLQMACLTVLLNNNTGAAVLMSTMIAHHFQLWNCTMYVNQEGWGGGSTWQMGEYVYQLFCNLHDVWIKFSDLNNLWLVHWKRSYLYIQYIHCTHMCS